MAKGATSAFDPATAPTGLRDLGFIFTWGFAPYVFSLRAESSSPPQS